MILLDRSASTASRQPHCEQKARDYICGPAVAGAESTEQVNMFIWCRREGGETKVLRPLKLILGVFGRLPTRPAESIDRFVSYSLLGNPPIASLSRTFCFEKWPRLAVDADRATAMRFVTYSLSH